MAQEVSTTTTTDALWESLSDRIMAQENADKISTVTDVLWRLLGDEWFERRRKCHIVENATNRVLKLERSENENAERISVSCGAARWAVEISQDEDGNAGHEVGQVTSSTGHTIKALVTQLLAFHALVEIGEASLLRGN